MQSVTASPPARVTTQNLLASTATIMYFSWLLLAAFLPLLIQSLTPPLTATLVQLTRNDFCQQCTVEKAILCLTSDQTAEDALGDTLAELGENYMKLLREPDGDVESTLLHLEGLLDGSRGATGLDLTSFAEELELHLDLDGKNINDFQHDFEDLYPDLPSGASACQSEENCTDGPPKRRERRFTGSLFGLNADPWQPIDDARKRLRERLGQRRRTAGQLEEMKKEIDDLKETGRVNAEAVNKIKTLLKETYGNDFETTINDLGLSMAEVLIESKP